MSHLEGNKIRPHVAVRRVAAASMAGMVLRALRPAGDDKEPRSQLFGGAKTPHSFAPERTQRVCIVVIVEQRLRAAKIRSPYDLQGFDARPVFPAGHLRRRDAGRLSGTVL